MCLVNKGSPTNATNENLRQLYFLTSWNSPSNLILYPKSNLRCFTIGLILTFEHLLHVQDSHDIYKLNCMQFYIVYKEVIEKSSFFCVINLFLKSHQLIKIQIIAQAIMNRTPRCFITTKDWVIAKCRYFTFKFPIAHVIHKHYEQDCSQPWSLGDSTNHLSHLA